MEDNKDTKVQEVKVTLKQKVDAVAEKHPKLTKAVKAVGKGALLVGAGALAKTAYDKLFGKEEAEAATQTTVVDVYTSIPTVDNPVDATAVNMEEN